MVAGPEASVFTDTSAWYALFVSADPRHADAVQIYEKLKNGLARLVTTDWILAETSALLHRRAGAAAARETAMALLNNPQVQMIWMDEDLGRRAVERYHSAPAGISLVDAASFAVMEKLSIKKAFAFDADFKTQGYLTA